jgi:D-tyrosyl-tRNA(Tyr) deacylase
MRAVLQRVSSASVEVDGETIGAIGIGLLVLLGVGQGDTEDDLRYVVTKTSELRIFSDSDGKMNLSVADAGGSVLLVSQFTLYADIRKGRRPGFTDAMAPQPAAAMVDRVAAELRARGLRVESGRFGADMKVSLVNDGPVTILVDSRDRG